MDPIALRELIRALLSDRRLPRNSANRICASFGDGTSCGICGRATQSSGVMYELRFGGRGAFVSIFMHIECFDLYEQERACVPLAVTPLS